MIDKLVELLKPKVADSIKYSSAFMFIGKHINKLDRRVINLEARQLEKGDKGDKGDQGISGKNGRDGIDGKNGLNGKDGKDGKDGKSGKDGKNGISIVDVDIALDNHLVVKLSDGNEIDAGDLDFSRKGKVDVLNVTQARYPVFTVSTTAPTGASVNDVWIVKP